MKRLIYIITIHLFASAIAQCTDPQVKPDLIIESVHIEWIPIVYGPNHPPRGSDPKIRGVFTLLIRNIGQADFQDAFYIQTSLPQRFGGLPETHASLVNGAKNQIRVGEALPVEIPSYITQRNPGPVKFVILEEMFDVYHNIKILLNDGDMTNNSFEYRVEQKDQ
jgi:hypothetical protein